jgi:hypothetical protein
MHGTNFHNLQAVLASGDKPWGIETQGLAKNIKKVINHCTVSVEDGHEIVETLIRRNAPRESDKQFPDFRFYTNKMLHIVGYSPMGKYVVAYAYDGRTFGMATVELHDEEDGE